MSSVDRFRENHKLLYSEKLKVLNNDTLLYSMFLVRLTMRDTSDFPKKNLELHKVQ